MKHSESLKSIAPAILRAQSAISVVVAKSDNPFFRSKYADLDACWEAVREPLQKEKLAVVQTMGFVAGGGPTLITTILHESGEYITGEQPLCAAKDDPQGLGSAITYARRYGLSAILGLVQVDDDAGSAMKPKRPQAKPQKNASKPVPLQAVPHGDPGAAIVPLGDIEGTRLDALTEEQIQSISNWYAKIAAKGESPKGKAAEFKRSFDAFVNWKYGPANLGAR